MNHRFHPGVDYEMVECKGMTSDAVIVSGRKWADRDFALRFKGVIQKNGSQSVSVDLDIDETSQRVILKEYYSWQFKPSVCDLAPGEKKTFLLTIRKSCYGGLCTGVEEIQNLCTSLKVLGH